MSEEATKAYKVVRVHSDGSMHPWCVGESSDDVHHQIDIIYRRDIWTSPQLPFSKIFVCLDLQDARDFGKTDTNVQLWSCEIENPERIYRRGSLTQVEKFGELWRSGLWREGEAWDTSTRVCDRIKLLKPLTFVRTLANWRETIKQWYPEDRKGQHAD